MGIMGILVLVASCSHESSFVDLTHTETFSQEGTDRADVLFVVDNSVSMAQEQQLVADGFDSFVDAVRGDVVDLRVAVTTTDMDNDNPLRGRLLGDTPWVEQDDPDFAQQVAERVQVGVSGSDKERGMQAAWKVVSDPHEDDAGFVRDDATLAVVFVSDENDCSDDNLLSDSAPGEDCYERVDELVPVIDYIRMFRERKADTGRVVLSAIVGPDKSLGGCQDSWPGHRYADTALSLNGVASDICEADFSGLMRDIAERVGGRDYIFPLEKQAVSGTVRVKLDGVEVPESDEDGFFYDVAFNHIRFVNSWLPDYGEEIEVSYQLAP